MKSEKKRFYFLLLTASALAAVNLSETEIIDRAINTDKISEATTVVKKNSDLYFLNDKKEKKHSAHNEPGP
ncbi:hypothetical protein [Aquicella lusitana]|uniref:Uncharacterized protein n=1 Tax=Aquicella lusitana TaxID=254246 RepID=A0A370GFI8_9COXI|nr:hypothetical protein [Aquicella lusitana]RDI42060.1 hypothetical protein C8D86_11614 [Aquicella lusitana]VVC74433.1 hypothetical protein AQULUS_21990 [Aquicella lusitana]